MLKNYDVFFREPGTVDEIRCRVCGTKCNVKRNEYGPTCYASAVGGFSRLHDLFTCPHAEKRWHELALDLVETIDETPSRTLARLMKLDLKRILRRKIKPEKGS